MSGDFDRDKKYLAWIRTLPCDVRGNDCSGRIEPHHAARAYHGKKGSDYSAMPLCTGHHHLVQYFMWIFKKRFNFIPDDKYAKEKYYSRYLKLQSSTKRL